LSSSRPPAGQDDWAPHERDEFAAYLAARRDGAHGTKRMASGTPAAAHSASQLPTAVVVPAVAAPDIFGDFSAATPAVANDAAFDLAFSGRDIAPTAIKTSSTPGGVGDLLSFD